MIYWTNYQAHEINVQGKRKKWDDNIYTFDIETTSYLLLYGKQLSNMEYLELTEKEKEDCEFMSTMYIWQFGINNTIYYGRTYKELQQFLQLIEDATSSKDIIKYVFVHNLSFEFQYLRNCFNIKNVMSRKSRKVMRFDLQDLNFCFRCTLYMTNCKLEQLPKIYKLDVKKLTGNLDYNKIRHSTSKLTKKELEYCENDCLVIYEYIKRELETYEHIKNIPITSTGKVRREFKEKIEKNWDYKNKTRRAINTDGHIYNMMVSAFAGGYTHANWIYADKIIDDVISYDFTSSYPYVMVVNKFPMSVFRKCNIKNQSQMVNIFAYILRVKMKNVRCKYYNNFISLSKVERIKNGKYDNGRIISAEELEIILTDIDFNFILKAYDLEYEILESYYARYDYLPHELIDFILEKYHKKTTYKGITEKELEYALENAKFNSIYGMCVTNNIKDKVEFDNKTGWNEIELENKEILKMLLKEKEKSFLSFSWGVWVTAYARNNLLENVIKLDEYVVYCDTDSIKLKKGYDINIIASYNEKVKKLIESASKDLDIDINKFEPKDIKGNKRTLGLFDLDGEYKKFITQGAKKYAYIDKKHGNIHITVSGVPKNGSKALKNLEDFRDDFIFSYKDTKKLMLMYNDEMHPVELTDYNGVKQLVTDTCGCCLVPCTYKLGKSQDYSYLLSDESSKRAIFKE